MFCMNCGTKLPDHAKFCFNCGAKVPDGLGDGEAASADTEGQVPDTPVPAAALPDEPLPDIPGSHFTVLGKYTVELPRGTAVYNQLWAPFNREGTRIAVLARHEIRKHLKEHTVEDPVEFSAQVLSYCMSACDPLFETAVDLLIDHDIDYVTKKDLWDQLDDSVRATDLVKAMLADKAAIEDYQKDLAVEKEANKASWQGGGFGITGAISGAVKASMMNTAQDALSSLGRSITGNSYSARLERFIRDRSAKRNYPAMADDFISSICRYDLFAEVHRLLVAECDLPEASFETDKADSRRKNLLERFANGKIEEEDVLKGLCSCLEITGNTLPVYKALLELEPSAARDVFQMAEAEGEELVLAQSVWNEYVNEKKVVEAFHYPDWIPSFLHRGMYTVSGPVMLVALLVQIRDLPQIFRDKDNPCEDIALTADTYWIPADVKNVEFWGMDGAVKVDFDNPEVADWNGRSVHFHLVHFTGEAEAWAKDICERKLPQAQDALGAGDREHALPAFQLAAEMGSAEAAWQAGRLLEENGQKENAQWYFVEAAVLGKKEASWALYQQLKDSQNEQRFVYRRLAAKGAQELVEAGKFTEALAWFEKLAAEGDGTACFYLGQMAEQGQGMERDKVKAMEWYKKAKSLGCEEAGPAIGALAFELGQQLEEKAGAETGAQAMTDWQQAWKSYRQALEEKHPGADEKIKVLGLQLGKETEAQDEVQQALEYYQGALAQGSQEALLLAARLRVDPQKATFDLGEAWHLYQKAAQDAETPEVKDAVKDEWDSRKALVPLEERVDCLTKTVEDQMEDATYYYWGEKLSNPLDNAMKSYGFQAGVDADEVVLLCDSTHSLFWGKGEQGFLITSDGQLISSFGTKSSLDQLGPVEYHDKEVVVTASGTVLAHFKGEAEEDEDFCDLLNEIVLLPHPASQKIEAPVQLTVEPTPQPMLSPTAEAGVVSFCPQCGAAVEPSARFCGHCGSPLSSAPVQAQPESTSEAGGLKETTALEVPDDEHEEEDLIDYDYEEEILDFCQAFTKKFGSNNYYFRCVPKIPAKKLRNAVDSYAAQYGVQSEDVLLLCDTTLFGSAKEGFLLTADHLVCKAGSFALADCEEIIPAAGIGDSDIILMPQHVVIASTPPSDEQTMFVTWFNELVQA